MPADQEPIDDDVPASVTIAVTDELDLHRFSPRDVPQLLEAWFTEAQALGLPAVRVIHGKGSGALRELVHRRLALMPELVQSWTWPAAATSGAWGATWVYLRPRAA